MGCSTQGYIITEYKDIHGVAQCLQDSIKQIVGKDPSRAFFDRPNYCVTPKYQPNGQYLVFNFWDGEDSRALYVHLGCDCDAEELGDRKIILSLGCWGNSVQLISQFMTDLGKVSWPTAMFIHANDCDGEAIKFEHSAVKECDHVSLLKNMHVMHITFPDEQKQYIGTYASHELAEEVRDQLIKTEYHGNLDESAYTIQPVW